MFGLFGKKQPPGPSIVTTENLFRGAAREALADAVLTEEEWLDLQGKAAASGIPDARARAIYIEEAMQLVETRVHAALSDNMFSPDEASDLDRLARDLRIDLSFAPGTREVLAQAARTWELLNKPLPVVPSPLGLQAGEVCHAWVTAEAFEERQRTRAVSFAGPTVSIPIMKGVRYRMGRYDVGRETYEYMHSFGVGTLVVTNKRLIFAGDRSLTARLANVLDVEGYRDGVKVVRTTGKPHTFVYGAEHREFSTILAVAWIEARS